ncbi:MAG: hypothetical protein FWG19_03525 [Methanomassiliicoccaceae archaeon]|nr:hypothetical protein [Methanomassiliicoccaceae archaeon]
MNERKAAEEWNVLCDHISNMKRVAVSFSGGADSTVLLAAAVGTLPDDHIAVFADVPMLSEGQRTLVRKITERLSADLVTVRLEWGDLPEVRENTEGRCYFCKRAMYNAIRNVASDNGFDICADGENSSDNYAERPGRRAAEEFGIVSPFKELGIGRDAVKRMLSDLRLDLDIVKETCSATRFPTGRAFTEDDVRHVEECEDLIRNVSGVKQIRMRISHDGVRLFTSPGEMGLLVRSEKELRSALSQKGVKNVLIDDIGYLE